MQFNDTESRKAATARAWTLVPDAIERVRHLPGVVRVSAIANGLPLSGNWSRTSVSIPGTGGKFVEMEDQADIRHVAPGYFETVGIPILAGRGLTEADQSGEPVIVLNQTAAERYLGSRTPIGARINININGDRTVVGVVGSVRLGGPESDVRPEAYAPFAAESMFGTDLVIKTAGPAEAMAPAVRAALLDLAPDLVLGDTRTFETMFGGYVAQRRFNMLLIGLSGLLAVATAGAGIYGMMAYVVEQRTAEIGIRLALGAQPGGVLRLVLTRALAMTAAGLAFGLAGAWWLSASARAFLFGVEPGDPRVYAAAGTLIVAIALATAWIPARRASRVDPAIALRT